MTDKKINYFSKAKENLVAWANEDSARINVLFDSTGTRDVARFCDTWAHQPEVIERVARIMGATEEEIKKITTIKGLG